MGCFSFTRILLAPYKNLGTFKFDILECEYFFTKILIFTVIHVQNNFSFSECVSLTSFFKVSFFYKMKENHNEKVNSRSGISIRPMLAESKGQKKTKADWGTLDSPKKWTNEFVLFAFLLFTTNKTNLYVRFLGESMACPICFRFYLTFKYLGHWKG